MGFSGLTGGRIPPASNRCRIIAEADLPMPKVFLIPEQDQNAFATVLNPEHAAAAVPE